MEATKQFRKRNAILDCLRGTDQHPSAEWIYRSLKQDFPDLSLGTVYRNLSRFREQGLIVSLGTVNGAERFDGDIAPHIHFVCTRCGCVRDLPGITPGGEWLRAVESAAGGSMDGYRLLFYGKCEECHTLAKN
ncbi:MAG: Fur family transcriptional regulator [Faecousia sp.]